MGCGDMEEHSTAPHRPLTLLKRLGKNMGVWGMGGYGAWLLQYELLLLLVLFVCLFFFPFIFLNVIVCMFGLW